MKINDFKQSPQTNEGLGDALGGAARALVGDTAVSAIKGAFTGKGSKEQLTQDLFFKDFYNDALTSLQNAVKSGIVDVNAQTSANQQSAASTPVSTPASQQQPPTQPTQAQKKPKTAKPANYYGNVSPSNVKAATPTANPLSAPVVNRGNTITANTTPGQPAPTRGGITSGGIGYNQNANTSSVRSATPTANPLSAPTVNKNSNVTANVKPGQPAPASGGITSGGIGYKKPTNKQVKEYYDYDRLNMIFESILEAGAQPTEQVETIAQYMLEWFNTYMQGVNWKKYETKVMQLIQNIENSYRRDGGKAAIKQLAKAAYAISGSVNARGAQNAVSATEQEIFPILVLPDHLPHLLVHEGLISNLLISLT